MSQGREDIVPENIDNMFEQAGWVSGQRRDRWE